MKVIAHAAPIASDGTVQPAAIKTGSAGLAAGTGVSSFGSDPATGSAGSGGSSVPGWWWLGALGALAVLGGRTLVGRLGGRRIG